jgi:hypothetical protein
MKPYALAVSLIVAATLASTLPSPAQAHTRVKVDVVRVAPPPPRRVIVPAPRHDRAWVGGHWVWSARTKHWRWIDGHWVRR